MKPQTSWFFALSLLGACTMEEPHHDPIPEPPHATVTGVVETDAMVANATVYLDTNDNNQFDSWEPQTTTDDTGHFTLTWRNFGQPAAHTIGAIVTPASGTAIHLRAPLGDTSGEYMGSSVISPYTTLVVSEMAQDPTLNQMTAAAKITSALAASQSQFSGAALDVMTDYVASTSPDSAQLRYTAGATVALVQAAVSKCNSMQSWIDCNDATFFNPAIVAMDKQLTQIAQGTYKFSQLSKTQQTDVQMNPGNYMDYFIDTAALADDIEAELIAAAEDLAVELFEQFKDEFVQQLEAAVLEAIVDELIGELLGA